MYAQPGLSYSSRLLEEYPKYEGHLLCFAWRAAYTYGVNWALRTLWARATRSFKEYPLPFLGTDTCHTDNGH
jgi:hypothetical protein